MAKGRSRGKGYHSRRVGGRSMRQRFLIVCEGEKTEPAYFKSFRAPTVVVRAESGSSDPLRLVMEADNLRRRARNDDDHYDQVWCVFDRDEVAVDRFNRALDEAKQLNIRVAYSNQAFELWFLLHYQSGAGGLSRKAYQQRLGQLLKRPYKKNDYRLYEALEANQEEAITRAVHLLAGYDPCCPADDDPSTTVHLLVQELRRFSRP